MEKAEYFIISSFIFPIFLAIFNINFNIIIYSFLKVLFFQKLHNFILATIYKDNKLISFFN